jgi:hypothetical protein
MESFEKLGLFYLGKLVNPQSGTLQNDYLLYDAKDLVTHAVCVGMTGSGKTGLCLGLLEEAAIDNIPAIIIDPKGDLGNLLLAFPDLRPDDFRPWVQQDQASKAGVSRDEYAAAEAEKWRKGLQEWGQDPQRIRAFKSAADFTIYTPGSTAGLPVSILKSFAAPAPNTDLDLLKDRIQTTASSLLGLVGIQADPLRSREHFLIASILEQAWSSGKDLDLPALIQKIQEPPMPRIGVFDLETFFPAQERFQLALTLNNLLAAPGFEAWMEGEGLEIDRMLYTKTGKPRMSIFSIAHLSDAERMFFVTILLNHVLGWIRSQPGTPSLRAILYMDEVFGFCPPVAEPSSKRPLLTLLKQARAFGLGVVLATQNPADLDYKGLSNAGTWFIGRLQTERDKDRLLEGLASAAGMRGTGFEPRALAGLISKLGQRVFLMQSVHEEQPTMFQTRWALSYLAGPLTRSQIKQLMQDRKPVSEPAMPQAVPQPATEPGQETSKVRPQLPPEVSQFFAGAQAPPGSPGQLTYHPFLYASARVHIINNKLGITHAQSLAHVIELQEDMNAALWYQANELPAELGQLGRQPSEDASYLQLPAASVQGKRLASLAKGYIDFLSKQHQLTLWKSNLLKQSSQPGEPERDFRIRLQQLAREQRDFEVARLRQRFATRIGTLQRQLMRAEQRVEREQEQYGQQKVQTAISVGATLLGAVFGRKTISIANLGRATTAARGATRISREKEDIERAQQQKEATRAQLDAIEKQLSEDADRLAQTYDPLAETLQEVIVRPAKADILLQDFGLLWIPYWHSKAGNPEPLYRQDAEA